MDSFIDTSETLKDPYQLNWKFEINFRFQMSTMMRSLIAY